MFFREGTPLYKLFRMLCARGQHYQITFSSPQGHAVLRDLARYCHAESATSNDREVGRRDVWLRIVHHLYLNDEERTILYASLTPEQRHNLYKPGVTYVEEE